jgi:hypothetical protein
MFEWPMKKQSAATRRATAAAPIAIPAIAPAGRPLERDGVGVDDGVAVTGAIVREVVLDDDGAEEEAAAEPSAGKGSPGWSMYFESLAASI